jgi:hypothetical protein
MTDPEPAPHLFAGLITVTATATAVHPDGADLTELPSLDSEPGNTENTETI